MLFHCSCPYICRVFCYIGNSSCVSNPFFELLLELLELQRDEFIAFLVCVCLCLYYFESVCFSFALILFFKCKLRRLLLGPVEVNFQVLLLSPSCLLLL